MPESICQDDRKSGTSILKLCNLEGTSKNDPQLNAFAYMPAQESNHSVTPLNLNRSETIAALSDDTSFDILIIGGGIHGATLARLAALSGYRVSLLERGDYASATSSRSSKMAHGGLRYLEMGDLKQVFEGINARDNLYRNFPHFVTPQQFLIPVPKGNYFFKFKLQVGLFLYDLMARNKAHAHHWIPRNKLHFEGFHANRYDLAGCFSYTDGILSDCRLVFENLYQARDSGALCLNYATVEKVETTSNDSYVAHWKDTLTNTEFSSTAKIVINCAGPWAPFIPYGDFSTPAIQARYSSGTHLLFNRAWDGPALFLPMEGKARYYFVWPHAAGTLVGTTEREVTTLERDPQPKKDEVEEVLARLAKDLPDAGLNRDTLHYAFTGVRTLPLRNASHETGRLSRKHIWHYANGMLSLLGGKLTTAEWTAWEGLQRAQKIAKLPTLKSSPPVYHYLPEEIAAASTLQDRKDLTDDQKRRLLQRYGYRASAVVASSQDCTSLDDHCTFGELRYSIAIEQAETLEDILRRRLELEYQKDAGFPALETVANYLSIEKNISTIQNQVEAYRKRILEVRELFSFLS